MIYLYVGVCFVLPWTVESFPFMFWRWRNKLKYMYISLFPSSAATTQKQSIHTIVQRVYKYEPPSSFLLPPRRCGLEAGSIPLRAIMNKKQCETRGLFMSLVIHYWIGNVQDSQGVSISQNANYKYF